MKGRTIFCFLTMFLLMGCNKTLDTSVDDSVSNESTNSEMVEDSQETIVPDYNYIIFDKEYKVYINPSVQYKNQYIDKINNEGQVMNEIALMLVNRLQSETNLNIKANLDGLSLSKSIKESNEFNPDIHFAIHSNGGGGVGSEVWVSKNSYDFGYSILESLNKIHNFKNRGVKYGDGTHASLYEIKNTIAPCAIIEILFHDEINQATFILNNKKQIADSFFDGIINYLKNAN